MGFKINLGVWNGIFCVPNDVADNCLKLAGGNDLKVLLYLLRNSGRDEDVSDMAGKLLLDKEQIEESVNFWVQRGILEISGTGELIPSRTMADGASISSEHSHRSSSHIRRIELEKTPDFAPAEIAATIKDEKETEYLFKHCEALYGRPLKHNEQRTLMLILEDACLSVEVAMILIDYCFSVNKATPAYMRTLALDWANSDIDTLEKAELKASELKAMNDAVGRFKKMFEVSSAFSKQQREYIEKWAITYKFSDEMINEAYQRTMDGTGKLTFKYMDKILENWHSKGIISMEQIPSDNKSDKKSSSDKGENSSLDLEKLQRLVTDEI